MQKNRVGKFLDGITSQPYDVTFNFDNDNLFIKIEADELTLKWEDLNLKDSFFSKTEMNLSFYKFPQKVLICKDQQIVFEVESFLKKSGYFNLTCFFVSSIIFSKFIFLFKEPMINTLSLP